MKIYTSRYQNKAIAESGLVPVRITVGSPRFKLGYETETCRALAPSTSFFKSLQGQPERWRLAYLNQLDQLGVTKIRRFLGELSQAHDGADLVLLCFEDLNEPGARCHRRYFAEWWHDQTGETVEELPGPIAGGAEPEASSGHGMIQFSLWGG